MTSTKQEIQPVLAPHKRETSSTSPRPFAACDAAATAAWHRRSPRSANRQRPSPPARPGRRTSHTPPPLLQLHRPCWRRRPRCRRAGLSDLSLDNNALGDRPAALAADGAWAPTARRPPSAASPCAPGRAVPRVDLGGNPPALARFPCGVEASRRAGPPSRRPSAQSQAAERLKSETGFLSDPSPPDSGAHRRGAGRRGRRPLFSQAVHVCSRSWFPSDSLPEGGEWSEPPPAGSDSVAARRLRLPKRRPAYITCLPSLASTLRPL
jgi:hypothetical protein